MFWRKNGEFNKEQLVDKFVEFFPNLFSINNVSFLKFDELGENQNEIVAVSEQRFRTKLLDLLSYADEVCEEDFFYAVHYAYDFARTGKDATDKKIIVHHIHDVYELLTVKPLHSDARAIALSRDPRAAIKSTFVSKTKITEHCNIAYFYRQVITSLMDISELTRNRKNLDCAALRLEDIHNFQKLILERICEYITIDFDPVLLESTIYGYKWWGDSATERKVNGFIENFEDNSWLSFYSNMDMKVMAYFFRNRFANFGYDPKVKAVGKYMAFMLLLLPMKAEREYLVNGSLAGIRGGVFFVRLWRVIYLGFKFRKMLFKQDKLINTNYFYINVLQPKSSQNFNHGQKMPNVA